VAIAAEQSPKSGPTRRLPSMSGLESGTVFVTSQTAAIEQSRNVINPHTNGFAELKWTLTQGLFKSSNLLYHKSCRVDLPWAGGGHTHHHA
jgi:hypothetical protein